MLIGTSGVGKTFTKEVVEAMASLNEVLPYSLSTSPPCHSSIPLTRVLLCRNHLSLHSRTRRHNRSVPPKKLIHGARVGRSSPVEVHLTLLNMMGKFMCLARYLPFIPLNSSSAIQANNAYIFALFLMPFRPTMLTYSLDLAWD